MINYGFSKLGIFFVKKFKNQYLKIKKFQNKNSNIFKKILKMYFQI